MAGSPTLDIYVNVKDAADWPHPQPTAYMTWTDDATFNRLLGAALQLLGLCYENGVVVPGHLAEQIKELS